ASCTSAALAQSMFQNCRGRGNEAHFFGPKGPKNHCPPTSLIVAICSARDKERHLARACSLASACAAIRACPAAILLSIAAISAALLPATASPVATALPVATVVPPRSIADLAAMVPPSSAAIVATRPPSPRAFPRVDSPLIAAPNTFGPMANDVKVVARPPAV